MPKLKADFLADWIAHLRSHLVKVQGWPETEVASLDDREVGMRYFDAQRRRISLSPRTIKVADEFSCPPEHESGWMVLQEKIRKGEDINSHLSTRHSSLRNLDGLLNEWGVHHFHLGVISDPNNPAFMSRTGPLLFAMVKDELFYAINVFDHKKFECAGIIEIIHRNWPDLIERYRIHGINGGILDQRQRRSLRSKNVNANIVTADGTVYMPISGGVMTSGVSIRARTLADCWQHEIPVIQAHFEQQLNELLPTLRQQGYLDEDEIEAELKISEAGIQVFLPKYSILVTGKQEEICPG